MVLANPPFTGSIDENDINDHLTLGTKKTELLFVERMMQLLTNGGRCGVIVPDGVLFGSSKAHKQLRQELLEKCQLEAIVSMPSGVFRPYAGVSAAVLVFTKGGRTEKVWFYNMQSDGYSLDDKRNFIDGKGDIPGIIERYQKRREKNPQIGRANASSYPLARSRRTDTTSPFQSTERSNTKKWSTRSLKSFWTKPRLWKTRSKLMWRSFGGS